MMPGYGDTTVPYAVNVTWFTGTHARANQPAGHPENNQVSFKSWNTMLNWRKTSADCVPLCDDLDRIRVVDDHAQLCAPVRA